MKGHPFTLHPFHPAAENPPDIRITGRISRDSGTLAICYRLSGECMAIDLPGLSGHPVRKDFLWRETCLELFVRETDAEAYREINLSPAGHWNIYRFDGYRKGMREEMGIAVPTVHVDGKIPGVMEVSTRIHLEGIIPSHQPIRAAVSTVVKTVTGQISYWALTHPGPEPDFHHRDSFAIRLN
ncbi:MAG: DOMON-like domain-containing protein [Desulfosalsimonadaceae bacterium]